MVLHKKARAHRGGRVVISIVPAGGGQVKAGDAFRLLAGRLFGLFRIAHRLRMWYHERQKLAPPAMPRGVKDVGYMEKRITERVLVQLRRWRRILVLAVIAAGLGVLAGLLDAVFGRGILAVTALRERYPLLLAGLPAAGLLIVFVYRKWGGDCGRGMGLVFDAVAGRRQGVPKRLIPLAIGATWVTHLFGGSVGREGVAVQVSASAASLLLPGLRTARAKRHLLIAAVAAGFSGLFRTPIAAVFFALELFHAGVMEYDALLPAIVASLVATAVSGALGVTPGKAVLGAAPLPSTPDTLVVLALLGLVSGLAGWLFVTLLHGLKDRFGRWMPNPYLRIALVGALVAVFGLATAGRYNGLSEELSATALAGGTLYVWDWLAKLVLTAVCLAAGFQGGEVAPLFTIGAALGAALAGPLGLPVGLAAALGYSAVFAAGTNTLIAPILVGLELFGGQYFGCFFLVCGVAYVCNGGHSIYPQTRLPDPWHKPARAANHKTEAEP